jgi:hypothetical protein
MLVCGIAVLSNQFRTASERSRAFAWWGIVAGVGLGFGPLDRRRDRRGLELGMGVPDPRRRWRVTL